MSIVHKERLRQSPIGNSTESFLDFDPVLFDADFNRKPFQVNHSLADHPLFAIDRLIQLAKTLPAEDVDYNYSDIPVGTDVNARPRTGLCVEETIRRIEESQSWVVFKNVQDDPEFARLVDGCLADIERQGHCAARNIVVRQGFVFIASPNSITPYHTDNEIIFLLQISGAKEVAVFPQDDRSVVTEEDLERFYSAENRHPPHRKETENRAMRFPIRAGEGVHIPLTAPHWVRSGPEVSIGFTASFLTREAERRSLIYQANHYLRRRGWKPKPVGRSPYRDSLKYNAYRVLRRANIIP